MTVWMFSVTYLMRFFGLEEYLYNHLQIIFDTSSFSKCDLVTSNESSYTFHINIDKQNTKTAS